MKDIAGNCIAIFSTPGERILNAHNKQGFYKIRSASGFHVSGGAANF